MDEIIKQRIIVLLAAAIALVIIAGSCQEECPYKPRSLAMINFHSIVNGTVQHRPVDSLSVRGLGMEDNRLYSAVNNIRTITLPMNGNATESVFIFDFDRGTDTIWFSHKVIPLFISPECGFILNFNLLGTRHTMNVIDSVVIAISQITTFDDTNIIIYN
jgi:hypothetical protein